MNRRMSIVTGPALLLAGAIALLAAGATPARHMSGPPERAVVWVTGQNLFYDTIVLGRLPQRGKFQLLEMEGPTGLSTEFGPGDRGYRGGRWWVDLNNNGEQDSDDDYFLCPLLPPGRAEP